MKKLIKKLHSARGETLVEVLAAVLICSLAVLLLVSYATAAARIDKRTEKGDAAYYAALNAAEAHDGVTAEDSTDPESSPVPGTPAPGKVKVTSSASVEHADVDVAYSGGDGVYSYVVQEDAP